MERHMKTRALQPAFLRQFTFATRRILFALAVPCLLAALSASAFAQGGNASLGGIVEDPSKALIPGVTITAKNVDTSATLTQVTNESGVYNFPVVQPGTYEVSAELPGFKKAVQRAELPYAGQVRVNFTLEIGQSSELVEVTASPESALRESSASVSDVLTQKKSQTCRWSATTCSIYSTLCQVCGRDPRAMRSIQSTVWDSTRSTSRVTVSASTMAGTQPAARQAVPQSQAKADSLI